MNSDPGLEEADDFSDFTLPNGCLLCDADLDVRITYGRGAHSYCAVCHWLSKPLVEMADEGMTLSYESAGMA